MGKRALALRPKIGRWVEDQVEIVASPALRRIFGINMRFSGQSAVFLRSGVHRAAESERNFNIGSRRL